MLFQLGGESNLCSVLLKMGKKNKKTKGRGAEKAAQKLAKKDKKGEEMEELETLIAQFQEIDKKKTTFSEEISSHPSPRSNLSVTGHPDKDELIIFGGEYFNGHQTFMYNDVFIYNIKKCEWIKQFIPNPPPPRCSHQAVAVSKEGGQLWIFGGEFASPNNSSFYHYKDLWVLNLKDHTWKQVKSPGGPSQRSGHRMIVYKKSIFVFGGFQESKSNFIYFNDCFLFSLSDYIWTKLTPSGNPPSPRSACQLALTPKGILIVGGYSKTRVKKEVDKGTSHVDMFLLSDESETKFKWIATKDSGQKPWPRSSFSLCQMGANKAVMFGGVCDEEEEEDLQSIFFNSLHCLDLAACRWYPMELRRTTLTSDENERKDVGRETERNEPEASTNVSQTTTTIILPCGRMNASTVIKRNTLYVYGGIFEDEDKQVTLNDLWSIDLKKMSTWQQLQESDDTAGDWFENEKNSSDENDDEDENDSEDLKQSPEPEEDEDFAAYFCRTNEYWLEQACDVAVEEERADSICKKAESLCKNYFETFD